MNTKVLVENNTLDISPVTYLTKYGGIQKICSELNINYRFGNKNDPEEIKKDFLDVYNKHGYINEELYEKYGKFSKTGIKGAFGSFNNLMKKLNIPVNVNKKYTKEDIIQDIQEFYNKYHSISSNLYRKYGKYSESCITKIFKTWKDAIEQSGLEYTSIKHYGINEILAQIKCAYNKYGYLNKTIIDEECDFSYEAVIYYYKSKDKIAEAIGDINAFKTRSSANAIRLEYILRNLYDSVFAEYSWDWLINDKTGKKMYVDFYIPEINTVIEYDGEQHERFCKHIHKTYDNFLNMQYRDRLKNILLYEHEIKLIRLYHSEPITNEHIMELINI